MGVVGGVAGGSRKRWGEKMGVADGGSCRWWGEKIIVRISNKNSFVIKVFWMVSDEKNGLQNKSVLYGKKKKSKIAC